MGKPITTTAGGICFAFPDVCKTPVPFVGQVPIPYPNIGRLDQAEDVSSTVLVEGSAIVLESSSISETTGDEAGTGKGVVSGETKGEVRFTGFSNTVKVDGKRVVRMFDTTTQNNRNAVGIVLGGVPTVLVGD
jgi:hypothetical protein